MTKTLPLTQKQAPFLPIDNPSLQVVMSSSAELPSNPGTVAFLQPSLTASNPWICLNAGSPSDASCTQFDIKHGLNPASLSDWALSEGEHGLTRLFRTSLKSVRFHTPVFNLGSGESFGTSILSRVELFIVSKKLQSLFEGLLGYTVRQAAAYVDSWSDVCRRSPNLFKYKQFGLVPSPIGFSFDSRVTERKQLIRILCSVIFIDRILAAQLFYLSPVPSFNSVYAQTQSYITSPDKLVPESHWVYQISRNFPSGTVGRACQQSLKWRTYFDGLENRTSKKSQIEPGYDDFGKVPNRLLRDMLKADQRAADGTAQGNISRCTFSMLTTWGQTMVRVNYPSITYVPDVCFSG